MDAVKFLEEVKRMCESHSTCVVDDKVCPIVCYRNGYCIGSALKTVETDDFSNIVNIVEQWSRKTRSSEFLKCYPIGRRSADLLERSRSSDHDFKVFSIPCKWGYT